MADMIIILILVIILGAALSAMRKSRAKGVNCIGCPDAGTCQKKSCH